MNKLFDCTSDDIRAAIAKALRKGANVLVKRVRANLKSTGIKVDNDMKKGVKSKVDKTYLEAKVHIMGDYRLKWIEKGTKERYLKKKTNKFGDRIRRGKMPKEGGKYFFKNSLTNLTDVEEAIDSTLDNFVDKL